ASIQLTELHPLHAILERQDSGLASIKSGLVALRDFALAGVRLGSKAPIASPARPSADIRSSPKPDADARADPGVPSEDPRAIFASDAKSGGENLHCAATFGASAIIGNRIVNVDPRPTSLSTVISPPIISQNRLLIASPRPVPPYLRVVDASACENSWNSLPICSGVMPMPVSATAIVIQSRPFSCPCRASTVMVPRSVNLFALLRRLSSACRSRIWSPCSFPIG